MYDTKEQYLELLEILEIYKHEMKFMFIYGQSLNFTKSEEDQRCLLSIRVDQLDQSLSINIFDRELDRDVENTFYRFKKPLFKKLFNKLFTL